MKPISESARKAKEAVLQAQALAKAALEPRRYCNRCGCAYSQCKAPCPECRCPEYSTEPHLTHAGWCRRQDSKGVLHAK